MLTRAICDLFPLVPQIFDPIAVQWTRGAHQAVSVRILAQYLGAHVAGAASACGDLVFCLQRAQDALKDLLAGSAGGKQSKQAKQSCELCDEEHLASHRCVQCEEFMCATTAALHGKMKATRGHQLQTLAEFNAQGPAVAEFAGITPRERGWSNFGDAGGAGAANPNPNSLATVFQNPMVMNPMAGKVKAGSPAVDGDAHYDRSV